MPTPDALKSYIINGIEGTPAVLGILMRNDYDWDARPDAERFTLREAVAHWADWDAIYSERLKRVLGEEHPFLPSIDEGALATERNYGSQDPQASLARFVIARAQLVAEIRTIGDEAWDRTCHREFVGDLTLGQMVVTILGHDAYHLRQFAENSV